MILPAPSSQIIADYLNPPPPAYKRAFPRNRPPASERESDRQRARNEVRQGSGEISADFDRNMWRRLVSGGHLRLLPCRSVPRRSAAAASAASPTVSAAVNSILLRSLKEHYLEVSKMTPPPVRLFLSKLRFSLRLINPRKRFWKGSPLIGVLA